MRDQLLSGLRTRLATVSGTGDGAAVLDPEALAEAERLLEFLATQEGVDEEVLSAVGLLHWLRAAVMLEEQGQQEEWGRALVLLMPFYLATPDALPGQVRSSFSEWLGPDDPVGEERTYASAEALSNLAMFVLERFTRLHRRIDGEAAIGLLRRALHPLPPDHPSRATILSNLGYALMLSDVLTPPDGSPEPPNLDEALAVLREAFQGTPREHSNHARCANGLALAVKAKALRTRDTALLSEAIELFRLAVDTATSADQNLPQILADMGSSLLLWADATGEADPAVLDEAVSVLRRAVQQTPEHGPERRARLRLLARAELRRPPRPSATRRLDPETRRRVDDLTGLIARAIPAAGGEVSNEPDNMFAVVARLLGIAPSDGEGHHAQLMDLLAGFLRDTSDTDLERKAFEFMRRRSSHLSADDQLDAMLTQLFAPDEPPSTPVDPASFDEVLDLTERLLRELPDDHPERPLLAVNQLMIQLLRRQGGLGEPGGIGQIGETVALLTRLMEVLPSLMSSMNMSATLVGDMTMMRTSLLSPFETLAVLEDTLKHARGRLAALPEDHPEHTATLKTLAHALFQQYHLIHEESDYQEAVSLTRRIVAGDVAQARRLVMAWGMAARSRARFRALAAASPSEHDLPARGLARLSSDEAVSAIHRSDAPAALEALEDGRALLHSSALNARRELENLRAADSRLAEHFVALRERIREVSTDLGYEPPLDDLGRLHDMASEWSELVGRIQALPEFGRFLMPLPLGMPDLGPAAAEGPVVSINVNPRRCDALALCADGVRLVRLPDLRAAELIEQAEAFHTAVRTAQTSSELLAGQAQRVLLDTLGWLWDVLAEPVLTELGFTEPPQDGSWPRLWWSPTGPLNALPLHAAGRHTIAGASVLDRAVSSYTPTLRALLHSRSRPVPSRRAGLTVAMPATPGHAALPETAREAVEVTSRVHGLALIGPQASRAAVLAALPDATVAHFACHASSDPYDPSASHLLLDDGPLNVTEISRLHLDHAELAYLSACATARGSAKLADEAIHLASAFQLAGYAQAVATLWEIGDHVAATMAADFHRELRETIDAPIRIPGALALHLATRRMREARPGQPSAWAAFLHSGA